MNWGLGHATRSIPIIHELERQGIEPVIASDGRALDLLKQEFPQLICLKLPGYDINYDSDNMVKSIAWQMPKIAMSVIREFFVTDDIIRNYQIRGIISDSRFGCWNPYLYSAFLSHQINIKTPDRFSSFWGNFANILAIKRHEELWIPDFEGDENLSGELSRPCKKHDFPSYIGALSRFCGMDVEIENDILVILSGPEPQRTRLEEELIGKLKGIQKRILIVGGKTESKEEKMIGDNIRMVSFMTAQELNMAICASDFVISRSGYSTIMDLTALGKKALLIPTPGQTEQEYLASRFHEKKIFMTQNQGDLDIHSALAERENYKGMVYSPSGEILKQRIAQFLVNVP